MLHTGLEVLKHVTIQRSQIGRLYLFRITFFKLLQPLVPA